MILLQSSLDTYYTCTVDVHTSLIVAVCLGLCYNSVRSRSNAVHAGFVLMSSSVGVRLHTCTDVI